MIAFERLKMTSPLISTQMFGDVVAEAFAFPWLCQCLIGLFVCFFGVFFFACLF